MKGGEGLVEDEASFVWVDWVGGGVVLLVESEALSCRAEAIILENYLEEEIDNPQHVGPRWQVVLLIEQTRGSNVTLMLRTTK